MPPSVRGLVAGVVPYFLAGLACLAAACAAGPRVATGEVQPAVGTPAPRVPVRPGHVAALEDPYDDPGELHDPETMTPLFSKDRPPSFPRATSADRDCWQTVRVSGDAKKDYEALVSSCGRPTGSVEYVTPAIGKLHSVHDRRDTFAVKIQGGLCYRFFGVADGSIRDLDILIERANGDLVGDDKTHGPVVIIEPDKNWCMDTDGDFRFEVTVEGNGTGSYEFGVWARPKSALKPVAVR